MTCLVRARTVGVVAFAAGGLLLAACGGASHHNESSGTAKKGHGGGSNQGTTANGSASTASGNGSSAGVPTTTANRPDWIVADWEIADFEKSGLSTAMAQYFFNNPGTFLILNSSGTDVDSQFPHASKVDRFTSFATMQQSFSSGNIPSGVKAIMYDNEKWAQTPAGEQADPIAFAQQAETLAHAHGLQFIFTPADNLATLHTAEVASAGGDSKYTAFLSDNFPSQSARVADVYDIQSQQAEATSEFETFVAAAVSQAKAANPDAVIIAGIGTDPGGREVSAEDILQDYQSVRSEVSGYWLNLPTGHEPQVAVSFLQMLAASLG